MSYQAVCSGLVSGVGRGLAWWIRALRAAIPVPVIALLAGDQRLVRLQLGENKQILAIISAPGRASASELVVSVSIDEQGESPSPESASVVALSRTLPVVVECPAALVLIRRITVPVAVIGELEEAVRCNLSTWTPFTIDDVYVTAEVVSTTGEQALVELRLVPRSQMKPLLDRAVAAGFRLDRLALGARALVDLNPTRKLQLSRSGRIDGGLAAMALLLMLVVAGTEWHLTGSRLERLRSAIADEMKELKRQRGIESAVDALKRRLAFVTEKRSAQGSVTEALALLARSLPAESDVQELGWSMDEGRLLISAPLSVDPVKRLEESSRVHVRRVETRGRQSGEKILYEIGLALRRDPKS